MRFSLAYALLVQQELRRKSQFDILATAMQLMEDDGEETSSIIDLTGNKSVAEFVDLAKDPEVFDLCSSSSSSCSSSCSSSSSLSSDIMPRGLLKQHGIDGVDDSTDSDISFTGTGGHEGLPNHQLIGTLIRFNSKLPEQCQQNNGGEDERSSIIASVPFFLSSTRL